jgi:hypothetical protein
MQEQILKILLHYKNSNVTDRDALRPMLEQLMRNYRDGSLLKTLVYQTINSANPEVIKINMEYIRAEFQQSDPDLQANYWGAIAHCIINLTQRPTAAEVRQDERETKSIIEQAKKVYYERVGITPDASPAPKFASFDKFKLRINQENIDSISKRIRSIMNPDDFFFSREQNALSELAGCVRYLYKAVGKKEMHVELFEQYMTFLSQMARGETDRAKLAGHLLSKLDNKNDTDSLIRDVIRFMVNGKILCGVRVEDFSQRSAGFYKGLRLEDCIQHLEEFLKFHYKDTKFTNYCILAMKDILNSANNSLLFACFDRVSLTMGHTTPKDLMYSHYFDKISEIVKHMDTTRIANVEGKKVAIDLFNYITDCLKLKIKKDWGIRE